MKGINVLFDEKTTLRFLRIWKILKNYGSKLTPRISTPHITLAIFDEIQMGTLERRVSSLTNELKPFRIRFVGVGCFPATTDVLYVSPVPTKKLLDVYLRIFHLFKDYHSLNNSPAPNLHKYFFPESWFPHVTIATRLDDSCFNRAFQHARESFSVFEGQITHLSVLDFDRGRAAECHEKFSL